MTLSRPLMVWSLRALLLWGAVEFGSFAYGEALRQREALTEVRGHGEAMTRLRKQAAQLERTATGLEAKLERNLSGSVPLTAGSDADVQKLLAAQLREDLIALGAQEPVITIEDKAIGGGLHQATIKAAWFEAEGMTPAVLAGLAHLRPHVSATRISLTRADGGRVKAEVDLKLMIRVVLAQPPRTADRSPTAGAAG